MFETWKMAQQIKEIVNGNLNILVLAKMFIESMLKNGLSEQAINRLVSEEGGPLIRMFTEYAAAKMNHLDDVFPIWVWGGSILDLQRNVVQYGPYESWNEDVGDFGWATARLVHLQKGEEIKVASDNCSSRPFDVGVEVYNFMAKYTGWRPAHYREVLCFTSQYLCGYGQTMNLKYGHIYGLGTYRAGFQYPVLGFSGGTYFRTPFVEYRPNMDALRERVRISDEEKRSSFNYNDMHIASYFENAYLLLIKE